MRERRGKWGERGGKGVPHFLTWFVLKVQLHLNCAGDWWNISKTTTKPWLERGKNALAQKAVCSTAFNQTWFSENAHPWVPRPLLWMSTCWRFTSELHLRPPIRHPESHTKEWFANSSFCWQFAFTQKKCRVSGTTRHYHVVDPPPDHTTLFC